MRVVCDNCRAVYKIPDSKLVKPVNKATCRNCGHRMLIPRPPAATEDERTLVTSNPMTPHGAIPRAGGPPTVPIQENEPEHTLPIQGDDNRRFTPEPPGRRVAGGPRGRGSYGPADDDDVPMLPGTPMPRPRGAKPPPRPSGPHVAQPPEEKTSWVRNPPPSAFSDTNEALRAAERGMKPSEEPTRVNAANPLLTPEPAAPKAQRPPPPTPPKPAPVPEPAPAPAPAAAAAPRKKPVSPEPLPAAGGHSYPGHLGPMHDPSNDMLLALLGAIGAIIGITLLALNPRLDRIELELALRAIALMLAFSGAFTNALVLITSSRGRRPARQVLSIVLAGMLATFGVTSAIGLNTLAYMWKTGGLSFTSAPTASLPPDITPTLEPDDGAAEVEAEPDATEPEPETAPPPERSQPTRTQPARTQPSRTQPARTQPSRTQPRDPDPPPREVITVPSDDGLGDDDFLFEDDPPPRREPDPPPRREPDPPPASGGMDSVPMEVIDIQLRNNIAVKKCFFEHMQSAGSLPPRVDVRFTLEPDGNVSRAAITQAAFAGSSLDRCLSTAIKGITFPPTSGAATKITFPFIFE